jgi:hypothetical protein
VTKRLTSLCAALVVFLAAMVPTSAFAITGGCDMRVNAPGSMATNIAVQWNAAPGNTGQFFVSYSDNGGANWTQTGPYSGSTTIAYFGWPSVGTTRLFVVTWDDGASNYYNSDTLGIQPVTSTSYNVVGIAGDLRQSTTGRILPVGINIPSGTTRDVVAFHNTTSFASNTYVGPTVASPIYTRSGISAGDNMQQIVLTNGTQNITDISHYLILVPGYQTVQC